LTKKYPKLSKSQLTKTDLFKNYAKIDKWLSSEQAKSLPLANQTSTKYWVETNLNSNFDNLNISQMEINENY